LETELAFSFKHYNIPYTIRNGGNQLTMQNNSYINYVHIMFEYDDGNQFQ